MTPHTAHTRFKEVLINKQNLHELLGIFLIEQDAPELLAWSAMRSPPSRSIQSAPPSPR